MQWLQFLVDTTFYQNQKVVLTKELVYYFYAELWWSDFIKHNWVIVLGKIKLVVSSAVLNYT